MSYRPKTVDCPVCSVAVAERDINAHLDSKCKKHAIPKDSMDGTPMKTGTARAEAKTLAPIFSQKPKRPPVAHENEIEILDDEENERPSAPKRAKFNPAPPPPMSTPKAGPSGSRTTTSNVQAAQPLAERMRPVTLDDVVGHEHVTASDSLLRALMGGSGGTGSLILWGPAGCGKTTIARLLAKDSGARIVELSATSSGTQEVRAAFEEAKNTLRLTGKRTVLFMDEIHRFNKSQQDLFLPYVEQGLVQLVGATTENPSFKINNALLSRCRVFVLERLTDENIREILDRTLRKIAPNSAHPSHPVPTSSSPPSSSPLEPTSKSSFPHINERIMDAIVSYSMGDARTALSLLELAVTAPASTKQETLLSSLRKSVVARFDRTGDDHYDMISALHKSVRGSDGSAALYWLARMLTGGEDPLYIARRCIVMASEDIGLANDRALPLAIATHNACQIIGMPECRINLAHLVAYLAESPKSTRSLQGYSKAEEAAKASPGVPVPLNACNAPTRLMKDLGYSKGYHYNPDYGHPVHNSFLPKQFEGATFLSTPEEYERNKAWDEEALTQWELEENEGKKWEGRVFRGLNGV